MRCVATLVEGDPSSPETISDRILKEWDSFQGDLAFLAATPPLTAALGDLTRRLLNRGVVRNVIGVTAESVAGVAREVEGLPALTAWAIQLPEGSRCDTFRLTSSEAPLGDWVDSVRIDPAPVSRVSLTEKDKNKLVILLADPFSFAADEWFSRLEEEKIGLRVIGGMASGANRPGGNRLVIDGAVVQQGAVGVALSGPFVAETVVSQGCRPIGRHFVVTKVDRNILHELGRRPVIEVLREQLETLSDAETAKLRNGGLHIGRVINEYQERFERGDFLIRNVIGIAEEQSLAISDLPRVGQTVQFQLRDAQTADEDLTDLLRRPELKGTKGALMFTCNGRGTRLFDQPHHDAQALANAVGPIPAAGFFAMGEFGPVGGRNFIHGFTASFALFKSAPHPAGAS